MVRRRSGRLAATIAALALAGCGVDRIDADSAVVLVEFALDGVPTGSGGDAMRDERGLFWLEASGIYVVIEVDAPDMEEPVREDWPPAQPGAVPDTVEIPVMVPAGSDRTFEALVLIIEEGGGLGAHGGSVTEPDLPGGSEIALEMTLEEIDTVAVEQAITLAADPETVVEVHPVDLDLGVMYPPAAHAVDGEQIVATAGALPVGRTVYWTALTTGGEWVDAAETTEVTP